MTVARGFQETCQLIFESTYGTTPTINPGDMVRLPMNTTGIGSNENFIAPETITPNSRSEVRPARGNVSVEGPVTIPMDVRNIGYWLKLMFGAPTTSGTGPYTHRFTPGLVSPSASMQFGHLDINEFKHFTGVKVNRFSSRFVVDTELTADLELLGSNETINGTDDDATPSEEIFDRFNAKDVSFKEGGVTLGACSEVSLDIAQNLEDLYTLTGNGIRYGLPEGRLEVTGTAQVWFEDRTLYEQALNAQETSLEILCYKDANTELNIVMQEVEFPRQPLQRNGFGPMSYPLNFRAFYQDGAVADAPIYFDLKNDVTSYA